LQVVFSELCPVQFVPPWDGAGLLQSLIRDWVPPPQVTLQADKELQAPQIPSENCIRILQYLTEICFYFLKVQNFAKVNNGFKSKFEKTNSI
jgi:hypothetical protein